MSKIIGIAGKMRTGKSTAAKIIMDHYRHGRLVPFSKGIKQIAMQMGWNGKKDEKGRRLLQLLGTECGRKCIGEDIWIRHWLNNIHMCGDSLILVDDVRFPNECKAIKDMGGILIKMIRNTDTQSDHASEQDLPSSYFDLIIFNNDTLETLECTIKNFLNS